MQGVALRTTHDPELAADVTQEAFLRLFLEAQAGRLPDNIGAWLYRTSANLIVSRARGRRSPAAMAPRLVGSTRPPSRTPSPCSARSATSSTVALATLSTADRVALVMAAEGATGEEIACHLGRTHGATRTLLTRARGRLRTATMDAA